MFKEALHITRLYLRTTYSSRTVLIFQLLLPLIFTFLIGQATGGFGGDGSSSTTVSWTLPVVNEDMGSLGADLVARLYADPVLNVVEVVGVEKPALSAVEVAVSTIETGDNMAALVIPANFSATLLSGEGIPLDFYTDPANTRTAQPIEQAILGAASQLTGSLSAATVAANVADEMGVFEQGVDRTAYLESSIVLADAAWADPPVVLQVNQDEIVLNTTTVIPSGINQSSPGMMAMFATFGMMGGAIALMQERQNGTLRRLIVMPIYKGSILMGKLIGILLTGLAQMAVLIVAGALFFDVTWGNAPLALALVVLAFALAITSMGIMMAALVRTPRGWGISAVLPEVGVLLLFTAVFLTIGITRFRYE